MKAHTQLVLLSSRATPMTVLIGGTPVSITLVIAEERRFGASRLHRIYCQRGKMENLINLHKAQLASDRMSCHIASANQVRLVLDTAAFWLMHSVRAAIPRTNPLASSEFATTWAE
jgi:hypothetical protein